jgi:hypothetical protein
MNLPVKVDDSSLLEHEPLRTHVAVFQSTRGQSRSSAKDAISQFVQAMRRDGQVGTRNMFLRLGIWTTLP